MLGTSEAEVGKEMDAESGEKDSSSLNGNSNLTNVFGRGIILYKEQGLLRLPPCTPCTCVLMSGQIIITVP